MSDWATDVVFYHLFPLGCLGAPEHNPFAGPPVDRISGLMRWIDIVEDLGATAVLLGPVFQSSKHGYDVADYFRVDLRLGDDAGLSLVCREMHRRGIRIVLDAVFHHTGREFWAFRDVRKKGRSSRYCDWYHLDFSRRSAYGEPFHYQGWAGHYDLVKLNLANPEVRDHLFAAIASWVERFEIDGLRLDAADALAPEFVDQLSGYCRNLKSDLWLMGEVVHGDYRRWVHPGGLASTTNYQAYKGLWSSLDDRNYFEIAYSLNHQFGREGIYAGLPLYSFVDNHDVDRIASKLKEPAHLYPLYALLLTMPGVPSIYYGSEGGIEGRKIRGTDAPLRPALDPELLLATAPHKELRVAIKKLIALRGRHPVLRRGDYSQVHVAAEQFAFIRRDANESIVVALNAADRCVEVPLRNADIGGSRLFDLLKDGENFNLGSPIDKQPLHPRWARILAVR
jgi:cyclomaltodextrinase / maltogenic alpha-amylase / neopullulanase